MLQGLYTYVKRLLQKLQHLAVVDQEMVATNDQQITIYMGGLE